MQTQALIRKSATDVVRADRSKERAPRNRATIPSSAHRLSRIDAAPPVQRMWGGSSSAAAAAHQSSGEDRKESGPARAPEPEPVVTGDWGPAIMTGWYDYDGDHTYTPRTALWLWERATRVMLPCPERYNGKPVYFTNLAAKATYARRKGLEAAREVAPVVSLAETRGAELVAELRQFRETQLTQQALNARYERFLTKTEAVKEALKSYVAEKVTFPRMLGIAVVGIAAIAALALLPSLPWYLGLAATAISTLYSVAMLYRWTTNVKEIPWFIRGPLAVVNTGVLAGALGTWLFHLIKAWMEAKAFMPALEATPGVWAAIPFAIAIETVLMELHERYERIKNTPVAEGPGGAAQPDAAPASSSSASGGHIVLNMPPHTPPTLASSIQPGSHGAASSTATATATDRTPLLGGQVRGATLL